MKNSRIDMSTQKLNKMDISDSNNIIKLNEADTIGAWWAFFGTKEILIGATAIGGILALFKVFGKTIKGRFRKCAKMLYNIQKDFGTAENGMNMKAVLPGVGSKITDWITGLLGQKRGKGSNKGALGIRPFVTNYINEIGADYKEALKSYDVVRKAGNDIKISKKDQATGKINNLKKESADIIYKSFNDARKNIQINESEHPLYEDVSYDAGTYIIGGPDDETRKVEVNAQTTREICYSIIAMFCDKYFNMKSIAGKIGINFNSLNNLNTTSIEKLKQICHVMTAPVAEGSDNKMYARLHNNYNDMVDAYIRIANMIVNNFEKYTKSGLVKNGKTISEKDATLLATSKEKLIAEVKRQEDMYKHNFFRVMNAIIASPEYVSYINFILEDVLPIFESGDADTAKELGDGTKLYIKNQGEKTIYAFGVSSADNGDKNEISKVLIAAIKTGTKIGDDINVNQLTCGTINLTTPCNINQFDTKFEMLKFKGWVRQDKIKNYIENRVDGNVGLSTEKTIQVQSIDAVEAAINTIASAGNQRQEVTQAQFNKLAEDFYKNIEKLNLGNIDPTTLTNAISLRGGNSKDFYTTQKTGNQLGQKIPSGIKNNNQDIYILVYPTLIDNNLNLVKPDPNKFPAGNVGIVLTIAGGINSGFQYHVAALNRESIQKAYLETVKEYRQKTARQNLAQNESEQQEIEMKYTVSFNESISDNIVVTRSIKTNLTGNWYVLSESIWGDGRVLNPAESLRNSMSQMIKENMTYDDFTKLAKSSKNINFIKLETSTYKVHPAENRFDMLSSANPLYENAVAIKFGNSGNVKKTYNMGIQKITV